MKRQNIYGISFSQFFLKQIVISQEVCIKSELIIVALYTNEILAKHFSKSSKLMFAKSTMQGIKMNFFFHKMCLLTFNFNILNLKLQESILPNFHFSGFPILAVKLECL